MERKRIDSKLMLFTLVLVLIVLLLLNWLLGSNKDKGIWNYEELDSALSIVYLGTVEYDRQIYYTLESIVQDYLNSYMYTEANNYSGDEDKLNYIEYYDYLTKEYKKYLSKDGYKAVADRFLNKFYVNAQSEYETMSYMDTEHIIQKVYSFEGGIYLCELKGSYTGNVGYIAIALDDTKNRFNLVYIE